MFPPPCQKHTMLILFKVGIVMSMFFYLEDGHYYPTTAGSILMYVLAIAAVIVAGIAISKSTKKTNMSAKQLVFCAVAIALAYLTSYIRLWNMPYGGSVTLCSMMFICMIGYFSTGLRAGLMTGFAYSILQFMQEPDASSPLFRYAVIISWHLLRWGFPDCLPTGKTA